MHNEKRPHAIEHNAHAGECNRLVTRKLPMEEIMTIPTTRKKASNAKSSTRRSQKRKKKAHREDQVVFAFRLTTADRTRIHKAAGAGKATRFVRTAALAVANRDHKMLDDLMAQAKTNLKS